MASNHLLELSDPSDWAHTSLPTVAPLDSALRCQVCKDYYNNAVITSCAHSFCSLCIRRCLSSDGLCPACRTRDQEVKLRRNVALQEVVDAFLLARDEILAVAKRESERAAQATEQSARGQKRKRTAAENTAQGSERQTRRSTRQQARASATPTSTQEQAEEEVITIDDDNAGGSEDKDYNPELEDGLVPCPMCSKRMKEEQVFPHLDRCEMEQREKKSESRNKSHVSVSRGRGAQAAPNDPPPERLPALNYTLYKEQALKQKLRALGISNLGSKALMMRRHSEWINLWNANCDSSHPVSRRELLAELEKWERSQGGRAVNGGVDNSVVMKKDFDGQAWATKNKSDFDDLIKKAREKRLKKEETNTQSGGNSAVGNGEMQSTGSAAATASAEIASNPPVSSGNASSIQLESKETDRRASQQEGLEQSEAHRQKRQSIPAMPVEQSQDRAEQDVQIGLPGRIARAASSDQANGVKTVPLFQVPQAPITDVEFDGGGGGDAP